MMQTKYNEKYVYHYWAEFIRFCAIFGIVWLHTAAPLLYKFKEINILYWWVGNVADSAVKMCVPLFFMLSGYLLLQKQESIRYYFKKRFSKIALPWLAWSVFYILWTIFYQHKSIGLLNAINRIISNNVHYHMWFLYVLVGLYLIIPILRIYVQNATNKNIYYYPETRVNRITI